MSRWFLFAWLLALLIYPAAMRAQAPIEPGHVVFTTDRIKASKAKSIIELLNQQPGVKATDSAITINGSDQVRVLLDGIPLNQAYDRTSIKWSRVSINNVARVDLYQDPDGGVILITSKDEPKIKGGLETHAGNHDSHGYKARVRVNAKKVDAAAAAGYGDTEGFRENDDDREWSAGAWLRYRHADVITAKPSFDYHYQDQGLAGFDDLRAPNARAESETYASSLNLRYLDVYSDFSFTDQAFRDEDPDRGLDAHLRTRVFREEASIKADLGHRNKLILGAGLKFDEADGALFERHAEDTQWAFANLKYALPDAPVGLELGVRGHTYANFEDSINPVVKLRCGNYLFYVQLGFDMQDQIPTLDQRFRTTGMTNANPRLRAEHSQNYTLTVRWDPYSSPTITLDLFFNEFQDHITHDRPGGGYAQYRNVDRVTYQGGQLAFEGRIIDELRVTSSYRYLEARDQNRETWIPGKPRHTARVRLIYKPDDKITITANSQWNSEQYIRGDNRASIADYYHTDLRAAYTHKDLTIYAEADNLFNRDYLEGLGLPAPPFTWIAGIKYNFK